MNQTFKQNNNNNNNTFLVLEHLRNSTSNSLAETKDKIINDMSLISIINSRS